MLLRPSWPATAVDASFVHSFNSLKPLYLWTAHSLVGAHQFSLVLSINLEEPTTMTVSEICGGGSAVASNVVVFEAWHGLERAGGVRRMRRSDPFTLPPTPERSPYIAGHSLWAVAPVLAGNWSFLGVSCAIIAEICVAFSRNLSDHLADRTRCRACSRRRWRCTPRPALLACSSSRCASPHHLSAEDPLSALPKGPLGG